MQRIESRCELDQFRYTEDHIFRIGVLPNFTVDREFQIQLAGVGNLIRRDQPRAEHRIAVGRFAKAALFGPADSEIQTNGVAGNVLERFRARDIVGGRSDHNGQFHLMVVSPVQLAQSNTFPGTDQRTGGFQE